jgi:hypothetical protein
MFEKYCSYCKQKLHKNETKCSHCHPISKKDREERHKRKEFLIKMLGGKCKKCGYNKSPYALSFHHIDPANKNFDLSLNGNILHRWEEVIEEAKKCELLCLNCHAELHNDK